MCNKCNIMVYPYQQKPLERVDDEEDKCNPTVTHPQVFETVAYLLEVELFT